MLFVELRFFVFFAVAFATYWLLPRNAPRKVWLLGCSYFFYAAWDWRFLSLILLSTAIDYMVGIRLGERTDPRARRRWVCVSLAGNLAILGSFKYFNFFAASLADLGAALGLPLSFTTLDIVLPVGISFYTFQTMSYSLDIYRGKLRPTRNLLDVALFVGFFPQLVAGPIVRAREFLPQLASRRSPETVEARRCLVLFLVGFVKKACIADNLAPYVDAYFSDPDAYTAAASWTALLSYAAQIYCDFSGYSDMAIGCAGLLGYRLRDNFAAPYLAGNIAEFWRRWHMSLSSWLRDYLYIPLGGSRGGKLFTYRNLMLTMLLGGLWHGASWNFVVWGGMHGLALIAHREASHRLAGAARLEPLARALGPVLTFYWVCVTWIFFRAPGFSTAWQIFRSFVLLRSPGSAELGVGLVGVLAALLVLHVLAYRRDFARRWNRMPSFLFASAYGAAFAAALTLVPMGHRPFIYFQF